MIIQLFLVLCISASSYSFPFQSYFFTAQDSENNSSFPFAALIIDHEQKEICNGIIIDDVQVLSSSECITHLNDKNKGAVAYGKTNLTESNTSIPIQSFFEVPYTGISVIKVTDPFPFNQPEANVGSIPLASCGEEEWTECSLISWRNISANSWSRILTPRKVFPFGYDLCGGSNHLLDENILCFGYQDDTGFSINVNKDDTGAGIACRENSRIVLVGIISGENEPGYVVPVTGYRDVLQRFVEDHTTSKHTTNIPTTLTYHTTTNISPTEPTTTISPTNDTTLSPPTKHSTKSPTKHTTLSPSTNPTTKSTTKHPISTSIKHSKTSPMKHTTKAATDPSTTTSSGKNNSLSNAATYILIGVVVGVPVLGYLTFILIKLFLN